MKTIIIRVPEMTLEDFANKHNLEMRVVEREKPESERYRFYAHFHLVEESDGNMLRSTYANGATPEEAINNYGKVISLKKLIYDAMGKDRKAIYVPRIVGGTL